MNTYEQCGFNNRYEYLQHLAEKYHEELLMVILLARMLGEEQDFKVLIEELSKTQTGEKSCAI